MSCLVTSALCPREASAGDLQPLYAFVRDALEPVDCGEAAWRCPVLLVDDLSVLLSLGMGPVAVLDFVHYCRATVCREWKVIMGCTPRSCREPHGPRGPLAGSYLFSLMAQGFFFTPAAPEIFTPCRLHCATCHC